MSRCIKLAELGAGNVAPNPMVGAVLVYNQKIIGEGYHKKYGEPHAEVNCINSVLENDRQFIKESTIYVSLEPCAHFGKTPPCVDLIIQQNIPHVVIGSRDSFEKVNGAGINKLIAAGIKVDVGILEKECKNLNKRFFTFHNHKRPYIILKWAQSMDGFIAGNDFEKTKISNIYTDKLVHKWRSEEGAILVGANTVKIDNPNLTTRNWIGNNPVRIVIDLSNSISENANIFNKEANTIVINKELSTIKKNIQYYKINEQQSVLDAVNECLYMEKLVSVIVEGGLKTLQYFINAGLWDESRVIVNTDLYLKNGIRAPILQNEKLTSNFYIFSDQIQFFQNNNDDSF